MQGLRARPNRRRKNATKRGRSFLQGLKSLCEN
jgi:hypothetical protein